MRRKYNTAVRAGSAAIVVALLVNAGLSYWNIRQLEEDAGWVAHTHEVLGLTGNVLLTLMLADAGQRDFLATGNDEFLQAHHPALDRLSLLLAQLRDRTNDNPGQQDRVRELEKRIADYQAWLREVIDQRRGGVDDVQMVLTLRKGKQRMKAIQGLMADMERAEHALLQERQTQSRKAYGIAVTTMVLGTALALLLIAVLLCLLQRSLSAQQKGEEIVRLANAALTDRVETRTAELRETSETLSRSDIDLDGSEQLLQQSEERAQQSEERVQQSEERVQQSEERVQQLTAHIHQVLWMIDTREARMLYVSPSYEHLWGRSCRSFIDDPRSYLDGIHPLDQEMVRREDAAMYRTGNIDVEFRVLRPDGSVRWVWSRGYPVTEQGQIVRIVGVIEDITEKRRLAAEREGLLTRLQLHIERMPLGYVLFDVDFRITDWNSTAQRIFGFTREEMVGTGPPYEKFVPPSFWKTAEEIRNSIRRGDMEAHSLNDNLTRDGRVIKCQWFNTPLLDDHGKFVGLLCLVQDVTDRKSLEEQFRQAQKMEAIGLLAAGVAHDFNNLLTIIMGYSELFLCKLKPNDPGREPMMQIRRASERAAGLTPAQLLAFGRQQILAPVVLDLNALMTETEKMLRRLIGADVELVSILQPGLGRVKADPGQIEQIIMNLAVNARDAMPAGGRLTIETADTVLTEPQLRRHGDLAPGPFTLLTVSDTGCGMDEATKLRRSSEPFFTTKEVGKGTGLGLATVFGIVKQSGGFIEVESVPGSGSTFRTYLPRISEAARLKETSYDLKMPGGVETILLVEDEDAVREMAQMILEESGYKVLSTRNGAEALRVCYEHADVIDLLFTDVVMPKMSGRQLTDLLLPSRSHMKVLYMSGYTDDTMVRHGIQEEGMNFLAKPFTQAALTQKIREVLDGQNGRQAVAPSD